MQSKSPLMSITVLGALLALFTVSVRKSSDAAPVTANETRKPVDERLARAKKREVDPDGPGMQLLKRHFAVPAKGRLELGEQRLDVLIATLPDPFDSHLDWAFDQALDAVRRAYESADFVLDGYSLPWSAQTRDDTPANRVLRETTPGAFLFRNHAEKRLELLYVVGEVPTSGVHRMALEAALQERDVVLAVKPPPPDTLRILGPFFSGSAPSLKDVLKHWLAGHKGHVDVVTGSATSADNERILSGKTSPPRGAPSPPAPAASEHTPWPLSGIRFRATVHPDSTFLLVLENEVLPDLHLRVDQVAVLNEGSTQYGASAGRTEVSQPAKAGLDGKGKKTEWFTLPFPMNLTSLRAAYARDWQAQPNGNATLGATKAARVELSLEEQDRTRETPRPTSPLTAPATDLAMDEIVRTLESRRIELVVLFATDVRDKLLLAAEIAKRLPDIQLVTTESNLLYLRSDFNAALRGMLVLSSYPLFVRAPDWNDQSTEPQELIFQSDGAEGVYNAALLLLDRAEALADYGPPVEGDGPRLPPVWITTVGKSSMLPVGLGHSLEETIVYPVAASPARRGRRETPANQPLSGLPIGLTLGIGLALVVLLVRALRSFGRPETRPGAVIQHLAQVPPGAGRTNKSRIEAISLALHWEIYEGLLILALWSLHMPCASLLLKVALEHQTRWIRVACIGIPLIALIGVFARGYRALRIALHFFAEGLCFVSCGEFRNPTERLMWALENLARFGVVVMGLSYAWYSGKFAIDIGRLAQDRTVFEFFFHRSTLIDQGVSPLLPLFLIGFGLATWCLWHLRRLTLLREHKPIERLAGTAADEGSAPSGPSSGVCAGGPRACWRNAWRNLASAAWESSRGSPPLPRLPDRTADVRNRLFRAVPDTGALALLVFLMVVGFWLYLQFGRSLERLVHAGSDAELDCFDRLLLAGILALLFTTAWAAYRFAAVWLALRAYLKQRDHEALHKAWKNLESALGKATTLDLWTLGSGANLRELLAPRWRALLGHEGVRWTRAGHETERVAWADMERDPALHAELLTELRSKIALAQSRHSLARPDADAAEPGFLESWLDLAHETFALELVDWIEWVLRQMRTLALFLLVSLILTTALLSCYPFHPQGVFRLAFLFLLVGTCGSLLFVIMQMNRNSVLSRITGTDPGQLTWDRTLVTNLLLFGVLPLATLASSQVPAVRDVLFAWLDPLFNALVHV
ncbi:MAG: hypothetical protein EXS08_06890 [Planctomycetes bacterium]|nr:hypothetical protein [Planctomycetota bacterium]